MGTIGVFLHINEYYINLTHIHYVKETDTEYIVFFTGPDGKAITSSVTKKSPAGQQVMKGLLETKIIGQQ